MIGKLVIAKRETRNARISSTRGDQGSSSEYKEQLGLYTKLFLVLGVLWILECVHIFVEDSLQKHNANYVVIFGFFDALKLLRGLFFFMIFIFKKSVVKKMRNYLNSFGSNRYVQNRQSIQTQTSKTSARTLSSRSSKSSTHNKCHKNIL